MLVETIRMVADFLQDGTGGVNQQLSGMTYDGSDTAPPSIVTFADETRNLTAALHRTPQSLPCLLVTIDDDTPLEPDVVSDIRYGEVTVLVRYISEDVETNEGNRDTYYTMRAVEKCLRDFLADNGGSTNRNRNGIQIVETVRMTHTRLFENINDKQVTCGLRVTFKVRDTQP